MQFKKLTLSLVCSISLLWAGRLCTTYNADAGQSSLHYGDAFSLYMVAPTGSGLDGHTTPIHNAFSIWNTTLSSGISISDSIVSSPPGSPTTNYVKFLSAMRQLCVGAMRVP